MFDCYNTNYRTDLTGQNLVSVRVSVKQDFSRATLWGSTELYQRFSFPYP